jgi:aspartyl-tRNA(Asn)/glutamyl-tRNA(Gln) amidotransferase subunit C
MPIDRDGILHIARLARLQLDEHEIESLQKDLAQILGYVEKLGELDTSGVPPTAHIAVEAAPLREDGVEPGLEISRALAEAPRHGERAFAVPAFVEES